MKALNIREFIRQSLQGGEYLLLVFLLYFIFWHKWNNERYDDCCRIIIIQNVIIDELGWIVSPQETTFAEKKTLRYCKMYYCEDE